MIKSIFRKVVFPAAVNVGADKLLRTFSRKKRMILMYHGVVPTPDFGLSANHLSVDDFKRHILYLKRNFKIKKLIDLFEDYRNNIPAKEFEIAITFDDGYANNYLHAYPVLKENDIPATIFLVTQALEYPGHILWYDFIDGVKSRINPQKIAAVNFGFGTAKEAMQKKITGAESLKSFMKRLSVEEKNRIIQWIKEMGIEPDLAGRKEFFELLSVKQVKEMADSGLIEIGSHTHNHPNLSEIEINDVEQEVVKSKNLIEEATGKSVQSIAFPDGSYNEAVKSICLNAGYKNLLAVNCMLNSDSNNRDILPRFCISNTTTPESNFLNLNRSLREKGF